MKNIMFIAPPAAGKGTQAEIIVKKYHLPHISTGDILREISKEDSEVGNYVRETLKSGGKFMLLYYQKMKLKKKQ